MKQKDLIILGAVAFLTAIFATLLSGAIFGSPKKHPIKVPVVVKINSDFPSPATDDKYKQFYNQNALNPTQLIKIGDDSNTNPFQPDKGQ